MSEQGGTAILAGAGRLPGFVADRLARDGARVRILALRGFADRDIAARADAVVGLLDVKRAMACLDGWAPERVALAGGVTRPGSAVVLDAFAAFRNRDEIARVMARGDDGLLRAVIDLLEERGHRLVGVHEIVPDLLAPAGPLGSLPPGRADEPAIATGRTLLAALSPFDIGQAAVLRGERVLAVEGPEGTDRMLARVRRLTRRWPWSPRTREGVLVKTAKGGQDHRVDLPAIGPRTVVNAARAGLAGIAVAAGSTLVIGREEVGLTADRLGLFVVGVPA